jgi:hypothetical protein
MEDTHTHLHTRTHLHTCTRAHTHAHFHQNNTNNKELCQALQYEDKQITQVTAMRPGIWASCWEQPEAQGKWIPEFRHRADKGEEVSPSVGGRRHLACCPLKFSSPSRIWVEGQRKEPEAFNWDKGSEVWGHFFRKWVSHETQKRRWKFIANNLWLEMVWNHRTGRPNTLMKALVLSSFTLKLIAIQNRPTEARNSVCF